VKEPVFGAMNRLKKQEEKNLKPLEFSAGPTDSSVSGRICPRRVPSVAVIQNRIRTLNGHEYRG